MSLSPIGDTLALTQLAYTLYSQCYVVARDAPAEYEELLLQLGIFRGTLLRIHETSIHHAATANTQRKDILQLCFRTLYDFEALLADYGELALAGSGRWLRRLKWTTEKNTIAACRDKIDKAQSLLMLVLVSELSNGRDAPAPIPYTNVQALSQAPVDTFGRPLDAQVNLAIPVPPPRNPNRPGSWPSSITITTDDPGTSYSTRQRTCSVCPRRPTHGTSLKGVSGNPDSPKKWLSRQRKLAEKDVEETIRRREKGKIGKLQEESRHYPNSGPQICFEQSLKRVKDELGLIKDDTETWLRLAIWWVLKSRAIRRILSQAGTSREEQDLARASRFTSPWGRNISIEQALADLLKSKWILDNVIRKRHKHGDYLDTRIIKLISNLSSAIEHDLQAYQMDFLSPGWHEAVSNRNLSFLESFQQPVESWSITPLAIEDITKMPSIAEGYLEPSVSTKVSSSPPAIDDILGVERWFTIDDQDGGFKHERILFRSFVNAQVGDREERVKTQNAPYMLVLWTRIGETEIFLSLCNQRNTLNLCRIFTIHDLPDLKTCEQSHQYPMEMTLYFPSQEAEIRFLSAEDSEMFYDHPKRYFQAMQGRVAESGELAIFQTVLEAYHDEGNNDKSPRTSCGLRLYESTPDERFKTTRRLVVSSSAEDTLRRPWCRSYWLPLSQVRLQINDSKVTMRWSDLDYCERKSRTGNHDYFFAYVYKPDIPLKKIFLQFSSAEEAEKFAECILFLTEEETNPETEFKTEVFENPSAFQESRIYDVYDANDNRRLYHAIVLATRDPHIEHASELFFAYRDHDFVFQNPEVTSIAFPDLWTPHYISTIANLPYKPEDGSQRPKLDHVELVDRGATLGFSCRHESARFMKALTGWDLKFFREALKLTVKGRASSVLRSSKTFEKAGIQLWEKNSKVQLAIRFNDEDKSPWLTASLSESTNVRTENNKVVLQDLIIQRGKTIQIKQMKASCDNQTSSMHKFTLTIFFRDFSNPNEFIDSWGRYKASVERTFSQSSGLT